MKKIRSNFKFCPQKYFKKISNKPQRKILIKTSSKSASFQAAIARREGANNLWHNKQLLRLCEII